MQEGPRRNQEKQDGARVIRESHDEPEEPGEARRRRSQEDKRIQEKPGVSL